MGLHVRKLIWNWPRRKRESGPDHKWRGYDEGNTTQRSALQNRWSFIEAFKSAMRYQWGAECAASQWEPGGERSKQ